MQRRQHALRILMVLLPFTLSACSEEDRIPVHPVQGKVTYGKKPATGAVVVLRPTSPSQPQELLPRGEVGADGSFQLSTYVKGDGAPVGEYAVTITWPQQKIDAAGDPMIGPDLLRGRFNKPRSSPWKVQIHEGNNELKPFQLR